MEPITYRLPQRRDLIVSANIDVGDPALLTIGCLSVLEKPADYVRPSVGDAPVHGRDAAGAACVEEVRRVEFA